MPRHRRKDIKLVFRKLGREKNWGQAWQDGSLLIEVEPSQREEKLMRVIVHEALHVCYPKLSEFAVDRAANKIGRLLWKTGYRRVRE